MRLTKNHLDILDATRNVWLRQTPGNHRSIRLLREAGLIEARVAVGPRGGRHVERRLTDAGVKVRGAVTDTVEGIGLRDVLGNQIRGLNVLGCVYTWD